MYHENRRAGITLAHSSVCVFVRCINSRKRNCFRCCWCFGCRWLPLVAGVAITSGGWRLSSVRASAKSVCCAKRPSVFSMAARGGGLASRALSIGRWLPHGLASAAPWRRRWRLRTEADTSVLVGRRFGAPQASETERAVEEPPLIVQCVSVKYTLSMSERLEFRASERASQQRAQNDAIEAPKKGQVGL